MTGERAGRGWGVSGIQRILPSLACHPNTLTFASLALLLRIALCSLWMKVTGMILPKEIAETDRIVFLHIPKTAGNSVAYSFSEMFGRSNIGWLGVDFTIDDLLRGRNLEAYRVIGGHFSKTQAGNLPFPAIYISTVREPVDRAVSYYQHILNTPGLAEQSDVTGNLEEDLLGSFGNLITNQQSRFLNYSGGALMENERLAVCQVNDTPIMLKTIACKLNKASHDLPVLNKRIGARLPIGAETKLKILQLTQQDTELYEAAGMQLR